VPIHKPAPQPLPEAQREQTVAVSTSIVARRPPAACKTPVTMPLGLSIGEF
jgi:hypothetical protein